MPTPILQPNCPLHMALCSAKRRHLEKDCYIRQMWRVEMQQCLSPLSPHPISHPHKVQIVPQASFAVSDHQCCLPNTSNDEAFLAHLELHSIESSGWIAAAVVYQSVPASAQFTAISYICSRPRTQPHTVAVSRRWSGGCLGGVRWGELWQGRSRQGNVGQGGTVECEVGW